MERLTLRVERGDGRFSGMSHDGAIAIVRNRGAAACALPALPTLTMRDARGRTVATAAPPGARFMHPGPVVLPIVLEPGAIAAAQLRWISGDVFSPDPSRHADAASLALAVDGGVLTAPLRASVWSGGHGMPAFGAERFTTALPPLGDASAPAPGTFVGEGPAGSTLVYPPEIPARRLALRPGPRGSLAFTFDGLAGAAPNTGSIAGVLAVRRTTAVFDDPSRRCRIVLSFYGTQLTALQTGDCGFGYGVSATGRYRAE